MRRFIIDVARDFSPLRIAATQNDQLSRFFSVELLDNGAPYQPPAGATGSIKFSGPLTKGWYDAVTLQDGSTRPACVMTGNVMTCEIAANALAMPGQVTLTLVITAASGYQLGSWPIRCEVYASEPADADIKKSDYYKLLVDYAAQAEKASEDATAAAEASERAKADAENAVADIREMLTGKQDTLVSGQNIKTINGNSLLGAGDIRIEGGSGGSGQYVTPDMFPGYHGTPEGDDAPALKAALESGYRVVLNHDLYIKSQITVTDCNAVLDGAGFMIHADASAIQAELFAAWDAHAADSSKPVPEGQAMITFTSAVKKWSQGSQQQSGEHPVALVTSKDWMSNESLGYTKGYMSYKGLIPVTDSYTYTASTVEVREWDEHKVDIRNLHYRAHNHDGVAGIMVHRMCHSLVDNCTFIVVEGEGAVGLEVTQCYSTRVSNIYAEGWAAKHSCLWWDVGYGLQVDGDQILVTGCTFRNNKHGLAAAGGGFYETTGLIVTNIVGEVQFTADTRDDGSFRYMQVIDCHPAAVRPIYDNIVIYVDSLVDRQSTAIGMTCRYPTLTNVTVQSNMGSNRVDGGNNRTTIAFTTLVTEVVIDNLRAPNTVLLVNEVDGLYKLRTNYIKRYQISNSDFAGITGKTLAQAPYPEERQVDFMVNLTNCTVRWRIENLRHLRATGLTMSAEQWWDGPAIKISDNGDAIISSSEIKQYRPGSLTQAPVIDALDNSLQLSNCTLSTYHDGFYSGTQDYIGNCKFVVQSTAGADNVTRADGSGDELHRRLNGLSIVSLSQSAYDALGVKDEDTLYFIVEG